MVVIDCRHASGHGNDDVGRIETTTQPGLDDRDIDDPPREVRERERGSRLEKRGAERLHCRSPLPDELHDFLGGDASTVDDNAFPKIDEVRRGVLTDAKPLRPKYCLHDRDAASLPVRAGNVNRWELAMRIAKHLQQCNRAIEAELEPACRAREEVLERLLVRRCRQRTRTGY